jgi:hypothetical protein
VGEAGPARTTTPGGDLLAELPAPLEAFFVEPLQHEDRGPIEHGPGLAEVEGRSGVVLRVAGRGGASRQEIVRGPHYDADVIDPFGRQAHPDHVAGSGDVVRGGLFPRVDQEHQRGAGG